MPVNCLHCPSQKPPSTNPKVSATLDYCSHCANSSKEGVIKVLLNLASTVNNANEQSVSETVAVRSIPITMVSVVRGS